MSLITWNDSLSVGFEPIDEQHRRLVELINKLHSAMAQGKGSQTLSSVLDGLIDYVQTHFASEEAMMKINDYPGYAAQKSQHIDLTRQVLELRSQFATGQTVITMDVMKFLKDWLVDHIQGSDKQLGAYLAARA